MLLVFAAAFLLPAVTVNSGIQGEQPRETLVGYFGIAGLSPAVALMVSVTLVAWLLGFGKYPVSSVRRVLSITLACFVLAANLVAIAFTHLTGLVALPVSIAVLVAAVSAQSLWTAGAAPGTLSAP